MQEHYKKDQSQNTPVFVMTLHAAKGLEFDNVILPGLEEGLLPSSRSLINDEQLEEERRLFYVGITRAQERILMTHCRFRYSFGTMTDQRASRFLQEIPTHLVPASDTSYWQTAQYNQYFSEWLSTKKEITVSVSSQEKKLSTKITAKAFPEIQWKKNQPVKHEKFGMGIVKDVEIKADKKCYVTIQFKTSIKKIDAQFLKII